MLAIAHSKLRDTRPSNVTCLPVQYTSTFSPYSVQLLMQEFCHSSGGS